MMMMIVEGGGGTGRYRSGIGNGIVGRGIQTTGVLRESVSSNGRKVRCLFVVLLSPVRSCLALALMVNDRIVTWQRVEVHTMRQPVLVAVEMRDVLESLRTLWQ